MTGHPHELKTKKLTWYQDAERAFIGFWQFVRRSKKVILERYLIRLLMIGTVGKRMAKPIRSHKVAKIQKLYGPVFYSLRWTLKMAVLC